MDKLASSLIRDILIEEMSLDGERVWIRDQNVTIPNDENLYIAVGMVDSQVMSVKNESIDSGNAITEQQIITLRENIQIDIHSRNTDAITRRWEIIAALVSVFSEQTQEEYNFKIFKIPSNFVNTSGTEGAENINKFSLTFPVFVWYAKSKSISTVYGDYYITFPTRVDDENTIGTATGLIEFDASGDEEWFDAEVWDDLVTWYG